VSPNARQWVRRSGGGSVGPCCMSGAGAGAVVKVDPQGRQVFGAASLHRGRGSGNIAGKKTAAAGWETATAAAGRGVGLRRRVTAWN
jgi:hypothetical protein